MRLVSFAGGELSELCELWWARASFMGRELSELNEFCVALA
jgi:hypothetical protein